MQYTLNLTNACNLACSYCNVEKSREYMSAEVAKKAADMALESEGASVGIGFYGGEPLLCKDVIYETVGYVREKNTAREKNAAGKRVFFKLTTNGLLLDEAFLRYARENNILISLSLDGGRLSHDKNRRDHNGQGSYDRILPVIPKLLAQNRYAAAMMTVTANNAEHLYDSVTSVYSLGFCNIICSFDYGAQWDEKSLNILKKQYKRLSELYYRDTAAEKKFFFSPFEGKINSHIRRDEYCDRRCKLGYEQISIAPDGSLYPCVQFTGNRAYQIGSVFTGIDQKRRKEIYEQSREEQQECKSCALRGRCLHTCSCINMVSTGDMLKPSPVLCAHERMLVSVADSVAEKLYQKRNGMFIQKHYNELYPLVSLVEDSKNLF